VKGKTERSLDRLDELFAVVTELVAGVHVIVNKGTVTNFLWSRNWSLSPFFQDLFRLSLFCCATAAAHSIRHAVPIRECGTFIEGYH
jgi:hypothetical protein